MKILSDARFHEMESELESAQKCAANMCKAHEKALRSYHELRNSKNAEIERLHEEIELLKSQHVEDMRQMKRLRQAIKFYEDKKKETEK